MNGRTGLALILLAVLGCVLYSMMQTQPASVNASLPLSAVRQQHRASSSIAPLGHLVGPPSITGASIDQVLAAAHSPAVGIGETMYTLSVQFHLDDAYALAFFHHESSYGKYGMAASTHSLGNIRCTAGSACDPSGGYRAYPSWAAGAADWYTLMREVYLAHGLDTVQKIIPVYAPNADHNNEAAYISSVLNDVASYRRGEV